MSEQQHEDQEVVRREGEESLRGRMRPANGIRIRYCAGRSSKKALNSFKKALSLFEEARRLFKKANSLVFLQRRRWRVACSTSFENERLNRLKPRKGSETADASGRGIVRHAFNRVVILPD
jgi:hypothetical protein